MLKPVHLIRYGSAGTISDNVFHHTTYCGIVRHRVYTSWTVKNITCKNCLKTKKVRKQLIHRLLK